MSGLKPGYNQAVICIKAVLHDPKKMNKQRLPTVKLLKCSSPLVRLFISKGPCKVLQIFFFFKLPVLTMIAVC